MIKKQVWVYLTQPKNPELPASYYIQNWNYQADGHQAVPGEHFIEFEPVPPAAAADQAVKDLTLELGKLEARATEIKILIRNFLAITHEG